MPDSTRAALWFVNNVTLTRFKDQAKAKKFAIKSFNEAAKKLPDTQISENAQQFANCCQSCFSIFNTKSKPSICNFCMKYFHKTNCLKDHTMICPMSSKSASHSQHQTARSSPISSLSPVTTVTDSSSYNANLSSLQSQSSTFQSMPLNYSSAIPTANHSLSSNRSLPFPMPSMQGLQTSLTFVPSTTTIIPSSDIASSANSKSLPGPTTSSNQNLKRKTANAKKNQIPTNPQDIKIEFLQTELAAAQTRIVLLDASLKDKEQMCSVLLARVKVFEERENQKTFQTYFPDNAPRTRTTETSSSACHSDTSTPSSCSHPSHCSTVCCSHNVNTIFRCCNHHPINSHVNAHPKGSENTNDLEEKLVSINNETKELKIAVDKLQNELFKLQLKGDPSKITFPMRIPSSPLTDNLETTSPESRPASPSHSVASIEEFLPVEPDMQNFSPQLNL